MFTIYTDGTISRGATHFGSVKQTPEGTQVIRADGTPVKLPHARYSLACDKPASGAPGNAQFCADLEAAVNEK